MKSQSLMLSIVALVGLSSSLFGDFKIIAGWDQQLFPSYIIATATIKDESKATDENLLGDRNGLLGIELVAPNDQTPIEITIAGNEFIESSTLVSRLPKKGVSYRVFPKIKYRYQQLSDCKQARAESFTFRVKIGDQKAEEKSSTITIHPIHDCPLAVLDGDSVVDVAFTFAAYVNEQHPFVDKLLREALDIGVVDKFTGYQSNDPEEVIRQVYALWDLFVARDVRYSSITATSSNSDQLACQHVRLLEDSINNQQANCVDGSVLLVSMLRKIGIDAFLVLEPGHCYAGFYLDRDHQGAIGIDSVLVGESFDEPDEVLELLDSAIDESARDESSWPSFVKSCEIATEKLVAQADADESKKEDSAPTFKIIDIALARKVGILPIAFDGKAEFVAFDHSVEVTDTDEEETEDE